MDVAILLTVAISIQESKKIFINFNYLTIIKLNRDSIRRMSLTHLIIFYFNIFINNDGYPELLGPPKVFYLQFFHAYSISVNIF